MMIGTQQPDRDLWRIRLMLAGMLLVLALLALALWRVQVGRGDSYLGALDRQSVRRVRLPGMRGQIFDRSGAILADNRPSFSLAIYLEEIRQTPGRRTTREKVNEVIRELAEALERPPEIQESDIRIHIERRLPLPLIAWRDLDQQAMARFAERASRWPGVDILPEVVRVYPQGASVCHVVGYVGRTNMVQDAQTPFNYYNPEMIGRSGVERRFDGILRGQAGGRLLRVDVSGFRFEDLAMQEPEPGGDVQLAIDLQAQRLAELALRDTVGAVVIMDPNNGDVLAMASSPAYDPNLFVPFIRRDDWIALMDAPDHPLLNRAAAGTYTPGSIFKPIVAFAALENDKVTPHTTVHCPGYYMLGRARINCWLRRGHGDMDVRASLSHSCNVYYCHIARGMGAPYIYHMAAALGLGERTGIALDHENPGLLPDAAWKRDRFNQGWFDGDTANMSIGQGALLATPLQMAVVIAAIANGGNVYQPRLVSGLRASHDDAFRPIPPRVVNHMNWSPRSLELVRGGMYDSVMARDGTGRLARVPGIEMAGKTGTAEFGPKEEGKKRGWMIAYAPFDQPRYAIAFVLDDAESGGLDVAPRVRRMLAGLLGIPLEVSAERTTGGAHG